MRHRKSGRKLGMDSSQRRAAFRNMVTSLMLHGQIRTTAARAKELRGFAERVITLGKNAPSLAAIEALSGDEARRARAARVHAIRRAAYWVHDDQALQRVFGEYAERFGGRPGGYTRVVKLGKRAGDNADMAVIQILPADDAGQAAGSEGAEAEETPAAEEAGTPAAEPAPAE